VLEGKASLPQIPVGDDEFVELDEEGKPAENGAKAAKKKSTRKKVTKKVATKKAPVKKPAEEAAAEEAAPDEQPASSAPSDEVPAAATDVKAGGDTEEA
jgi:small subunit ribosomal protein S2